MIRNEEMINKKTWEEFREAGLLWFTNMILHTFGWSIVVEKEEGKIIDVFPARVSFRGFDEKSNTDGYKKLTTYMSKNHKELLDETYDK